MAQAFFLTSGPPVPVVGARRVRDAEIISLLARKMPVRVLANFQGAMEKSNPVFKKDCTDYFGSAVQTSLHRNDPDPFHIQLLDLVRPHFAQGYSVEMDRILRTEVKPGDLVWLSRLRMAKYMKIAKEVGAHVILDEHQIESDLLFDNAFSHIQYWPQGWTALQCALYERRLTYDASAVVTSSSIDAFRLQKLAPKSKVHIIPPTVPFEDYTVQSHDETTDGSPGALGKILFFGDLAYLPNVNAVEWLAREILPRLKRTFLGELPEILVASENGDLESLKKNFPELTVIQYSSHDELLKIFSESTLAVFPLRYGRGNRIHLLEALAAGLPVVSTGPGADGLVLKPSYDLCIGEEVDEFTSHIVRLIRNPKEREEYRIHAQNTVKNKFNLPQESEALNQVLDFLGVRLT